MTTSESLFTLDPKGNLSLGTRIYKVNNTGDSLPLPETYIITSAAALHFQLRLWVCGEQLKKYVIGAGEDLFKAAYYLNLLPDSPEQLFELCIATGGLIYHLPKAFENAFPDATLQRCLISAKRSKTENGLDWIAQVKSYFNFEAFEAVKEAGLDSITLVIGDTIATGSTLIAVIPFVINYINDFGVKVDKILLFSHAAGRIGLDVAKNIEKDIQEKNPDFKIIVLATNILPHLREDGTALRFRKDQYDGGGNAILPQEVLEQVHLFYQDDADFFMKNINICGDWGRRGHAPISHLVETKKHYEAVAEQAHSDSAKKRLERYFEQVDYERAHHAKPISSHYV